MADGEVEAQRREIRDRVVDPTQPNDHSASTHQRDRACVGEETSAGRSVRPADGALATAEPSMSIETAVDKPSMLSAGRSSYGAKSRRHGPQAAL